MQNSRVIFNALFISKCAWYSWYTSIIVQLDIIHLIFQTIPIIFSPENLLRLVRDYLQLITCSTTIIVYPTCIILRTLDCGKFKEL